MPTTNRDYYEILGVPRGATESEIKRAFRARARELHPDVNREDPMAEEHFKELAEAYKVLSTPETRELYDRFGHEGLRGGPASDFADLGSFQDLFDAFFGGDLFGRRSGMRRAPGDDVLVGVEVSFVESAVGTRRELDLELVETCEACEGSGARPDSRIERCSRCAGQGQVRQVTRGPFGQFIRTSVCPDCRGEGRVALDRCDLCHGNGRHRAVRRIPVDIPAGIAEGQRIRLTGSGHTGEPGAPPGDLYVEVAVLPDPRFRREGLDVVAEATITVAEAMLGTTIVVPTVTGDSELELAAGTQPRHEVLLRGKGFPQVQGRGRGDQRIVVDVRVPRVKSQEGRELVARLAELVQAGEEEGEGLFGRFKHVFK